MDAPMVNDESSRQLLLIAQRDETKKIFDIPKGSFLEAIVDQGEEFVNRDAEAINSNPYFLHQRMFRVKNLLDDDEKTIIVETVKKDKLSHTTFKIVKMTPRETAANRLEISYTRYDDNQPSAVIVNAVPNGQLNGISFELDWQNQISFIDDTTRVIRQPTMDINAKPLELRLFDGMTMGGFKADQNSLSFEMRGFPYPKSKPVAINLPRKLAR